MFNKIIIFSVGMVSGIVVAGLGRYAKRTKLEDEYGKKAGAEFTKVTMCEDGSVEKREALRNLNFSQGVLHGLDMM